MELPSPDDRSLLGRIAAGDERAAEAFDGRFRHRLLRFAQSRRIPVQDQNDLVQDVLCAAFERIQEDKFHGESSLGTWLVGILRHKIADYWQQHRRERDSVLPAVNTQITEGQTALDRHPDPHPHPDVAIELREILDTLPTEHRVVLLLNLTEGWSTDDIATILKMRPGTVGRVLWEAKRMLRESRHPLKKLARGKD